MANRSYLYATGDKKSIGISEYGYDIPLSFKILVSQDAKIVDSIIWDDSDIFDDSDEQQTAVQGDFVKGRKKFFDFLDMLAKEKVFAEYKLVSKLLHYIAQTKEFLNDKAHANRYFRLENGELYAMNASSWQKQNKTLFDNEILKIDNEIQSFLVGLRKANDKAEVDDLLESLALNDWNDILYYGLSEPEKEELPKEKDKKKEAVKSKKINIVFLHPVDDREMKIGLHPDMLFGASFDLLAGKGFLDAGNSYSGVMENSRMGMIYLENNATIEFNRLSNKDIVIIKTNAKDKYSLKPGNHYLIADILWRVLDVQNGKALLITEKALEERHYNDEKAESTWERCSLRKYLNDEFYNSLGTEKSQIADTRVCTPDNPWYGTAGGSTTSDKIFLLSIEEVVKYFGDSGGLAFKPSKDVIYEQRGDKGWARTDKPDMSKRCWLGDQYNKTRQAFRSLYALGWWLRSPGIDSRSAALVSSVGILWINGVEVQSEGVGWGVRPALWLDLA